MTGARFISIDRAAVQQTEAQLQEAGAAGMESWILWSGSLEGDRFQVKTVHIPEQEASSGPDGMMVMVNGPALHDLNVWLYEHEQQLGVQVHAHPRAAFHSSTDNAFSIVTAVGGFSLVAADFCARGLLHRSTHCFRLGGDGWRRLRRPPRRLLQVADGAR